MDLSSTRNVVVECRYMFVESFRTAIDQERSFVSIDRVCNTVPRVNNVLVENQGNRRQYRNFLDVDDRWRMFWIDFDLIVVVHRGIKSMKAEIDDYFCIIHLEIPVD